MKRVSTSERFGSPISLGPAINTEAGEAAPTLSPDGRTLLFASDREIDDPNSYPSGTGWRLYMATRESAYGPFGTPEPLYIRTPGSEATVADAGPSISPDGSTLYFSREIVIPDTNIWEVPILRGGHPFCDMTTDFYEKVLGRAPEAPPEAEENVLDVWQHGYYYYAVDWEVDVRLHLFALAYNLGNSLRSLALPRKIKHWSLT
jgi:hypothetical protein